MSINEKTESVKFSKIRGDVVKKKKTGHLNLNPTFVAYHMFHPREGTQSFWTLYSPKGINNSCSIFLTKFLWGSNDGISLKKEECIILTKYNA